MMKARDSNADTVAGPRFCPRCGTTAGDRAALCASCGETLVEQAYCPVCEIYLPLTSGSTCPKHGVPLESGPTLIEDPLPREVQGGCWTTVARCASMVEADARRLRLEEEGIPTFLEGERMGNLWLYQTATGGVKLQVPESLVADARVVLDQKWSPLIDDEEDPWDDLDPVPEPASHRRQIMKVLIVLFLLTPFLVMLLSSVLRFIS